MAGGTAVASGSRCGREGVGISAARPSRPRGDSGAVAAHTLVYVHGLGDDETAWHRLWAEAALAGTRNDAYAVPGMGGRPWRGERIEDVARDLCAYIDALTGPVVLVGHSLGGVVGTLLAETPPAALRGFVNIEGNLTPADCDISGAAARAGDDFARWFRLLRGRMPARYARALDRADAAAFRAMAEDLVRLSDGLADRYRALAVPRRLIYGSDGYAAATQEWVRSAPVDAVRIDGAGHWVQGDAPAATAAAIGDFVAAVERGG